jgi:hypothetical protein
MMSKPAIMHTSNIGGHHIAGVPGNSISPKPYKWQKETATFSGVI